MSETTTATCPKPGIYEMTRAEYTAIPAVNCSTLDWGTGSMYHLKAAIDGHLEREDTSALEFGRAMHIRILQPDLYSQLVKQVGTCEAVLTSGKRKGEKCGSTGKGLVDGKWFCGTHDGNENTLDPHCEYVTADEAARIERCLEAIKGRKIDNLRRAKGQYEVCVIGDLMGVTCKALLDKYIPTPSTIIDLKKVAAPKKPRDVRMSADLFRLTIPRYGYGMRSAFYCDLVKAVTGNMPRWYWLVVEDDEPYCTGVYKASEDDLAAGRFEYASLLTQYKQCLESGEWPGPADDPVEIEAPANWRARNGG